MGEQKQIACLLLGGFFHPFHDNSAGSWFYTLFFSFLHTKNEHFYVILHNGYFSARGEKMLVIHI